MTEERFCHKLGDQPQLIQGPGTVSYTHLLTKAQELTNIPLHVVEWRADFYQDVNDLPSVLSTLRALREALGNIPILFTFRTRKEGGERELPLDRYTQLNLAAALSGDVDAVDVEIFSGDSVVRENIDGIHQAGRIVVGSNHDFQRTPSQADLIFRLRKMQDMGADIPKIAVMPRSAGDVLTLLSATEEMARCYADRPIITIDVYKRQPIDLHFEPSGMLLSYLGHLFIPFPYNL